MILGVDPGQKGGLALLTDGGYLLDVQDMPVVNVQGKDRVSAPLLAKQIATWAPRLAVIERVGAMPKQGVSSTFVFGYSAGLIEGVCAAAGIPVVFVAPAIWKKAMKVTASKGSSLQMAQRLWPALADRFARVRDDGRAEAALIGFHGRTQWQRAAA